MLYICGRVNPKLIQIYMETNFIDNLRNRKTNFPAPEEAIDKANAAGGRTRIPEITLLTLSALGGGVGAMMGRTFLHHKSNARRKMHFAIVLWMSFIMQIALGGYLYFMGG